MYMEVKAMGKKVIGILVGSLRRESFSKKIALHLAGLLKAHFDVKFLDIGNLAMYNQDLDDDNATPKAWQDFRQEVKALDGVLFVPPEYNRSFPPVLKNALDIASRPYGKNAWAGKPGAAVSVSPGKLGGFGANHHLRQAVAFLDIFMMGQPEAYIGEVIPMLNETGVADENLKKFLQLFADSFVKWVNRILPH